MKKIWFKGECVDWKRRTQIYWDDVEQTYFFRVSKIHAEGFGVTEKRICMTLDGHTAFISTVFKDVGWYAVRWKEKKSSLEFICELN